ncbi:glycosyltransferase family A protein [Parvularcula sp. IMCC14364]|uniref:glycosyltransferase family 2 protein n=1 Tax=Parvularcula sp. IMCC14364 TaxID=3067902 RepID=UPI0027418ED1|nr:glycosyltransferase family A protein [Parvularcula sp. IMCC14364]
MQPAVQIEHDRPVGMVITAYKMGTVLTDTINSLLHQQDIDLAALVLIVDGCPMTETTGRICQRYARALPGKFHYIWLENGGVSRARNVGVKWILDNFSDVEGIFLLDGDDLVTERCVATSFDTLKEGRKNTATNGSAGWVVMDQIQFGHAANSLSYPTQFRAMRWLGSNLSPPSGLISREMFEAGVLWDESMRQGIEDWEYWYTAMDRGFYSVKNPDAYLKYRRLTGNRSSLNRSKDALTKDYVRGKHADLLHVRHFLAEEQETFPRWALFEGTASSWKLFSNPEYGFATVPATAFAEAVTSRYAKDYHSAYIIDPYFPDLLAFMDDSVVRLLSETGLLKSVLYEAEAALLKSGICALNILTTDETDAAGHPQTTLRLTDIKASPADHHAQGLFFSVGHFHERAEKSTAHSALSNVARAFTEVQTLTKITVELPAQHTALHNLKAVNSLQVMSLFADAFTALRVESPPSKLMQDNYNVCGQDKAKHHTLGAELFGVWPVLPAGTSETSRDVALLLPEQVDAALQETVTALFNRPEEIRYHLVSIGDTLSGLPDDLLEKSASRIFLRINADAWTPGHTMNYYGLPLYERIPLHLQEPVIGRLADMSATVNFAGPMLSGPLMALRKTGCMNFLLYHPDADISVLSDFYPSSAGKAALRDPYAVQAYTGAYTSIVTLDQKAADKLEAAGITPLIIGYGFDGIFTEIMAEDTN